MNQPDKPVTPAGQSAKQTASPPAAVPPKVAPQQKRAVSKPRPAQTQTSRRAVRFEVELPPARNISVAGTFNGWDPTDAPLVFIGRNRWYTYLLLAPGRYEYRFVVDGKWVDPPKAKAYVANPYGSRNAVMEV